MADFSFLKVLNSNKIIKPSYVMYEAIFEDGTKNILVPLNESNNFENKFNDVLPQTSEIFLENFEYKFV